MDKWDYIDFIRADYKKDPYGYSLIALMDFYNKDNLMQITLEEAKEYYIKQQCGS